MRPPTDFLFLFSLSLSLFSPCSGGSLPPRKSLAPHTGVSTFQGEPLLLELCFPAKAGGEGREGVQIKVGFEVSIIFGMLLRV